MPDKSTGLRGEGWSFAGEALEAALGEARDEAAVAEVLLRRSKGLSLRAVRGSLPECGSWEEAASAVRVRLSDGRTGLASTIGFGGAAEAGRVAARLARACPARSGDAEPDEGHWAAWPAHGMGERVSSGAPALEPPTRSELQTLLARIEKAALAADARVAALDASTLRAAIVTSYLVRSTGVAVHQRQAAFQAHGAAIARDGLRVGGHSDAWASAGMAEAEAAEFGARLGAGAVIALSGVSGLPAEAPLLLTPQVVGELTFAWAPLLLCLVESRLPRDEELAAPQLELVEDSCLDQVSRAMPVDGDGRRLLAWSLLAGGRWRPPPSVALPRLRIGTGDRPQPGWLRLSWRWSGAPLSPQALDEGLGSGLKLTSVRTLAVDPWSLTWLVSAAGWWFEGGRPHHAVARASLALSFPGLLAGARGMGADHALAHASGRVAAPSLLIRTQRLRA